MTSPGRRFRNTIFGHFARVGKALANPHRLELLELLAQGPRTVETLARATAMTVSNASQHLQVLRFAGLVGAEREGLHVIYRLAGEDVARLCLSLQRVAELHLADVDRVARQFFTDRDAMEPIDPGALLERVRRGEAVVLDVRPLEEYAAGHLPAAVSIPLQELERRLAELPSDETIVAYCRGPYCVLALEALRVLRVHGFDARRLGQGVLEWQTLGLPVETGVPRSVLPAPQ